MVSVRIHVLHFLVVFSLSSFFFSLRVDISSRRKNRVRFEFSRLPSFFFFFEKEISSQGRIEFDLNFHFLVFLPFSFLFFFFWKRNFFIRKYRVRFEFSRLPLFFFFLKKKFLHKKESSLVWNFLFSSSSFSFFLFFFLKKKFLHKKESSLNFHFLVFPFFLFLLSKKKFIKNRI